MKNYITEIDGIKIPDTSNAKTKEERAKIMKPFLKIFLNRRIRKEVIKQNNGKILEESYIEQFYIKRRNVGKDQIEERQIHWQPGCPARQRRRIALALHHGETTQLHTTHSQRDTTRRNGGLPACQILGSPARCSHGGYVTGDS